MLNYRLLIVSICIIIAIVLYLFYWNRIIGFFIGRLIRLLFWNQRESSIWVDVGSIHLSILGGRILLKDLEYHSSNQTIRVVKGQVSWRYWIRAPADEDDLSHARVVGEDIGRKSHKSPLDCRVHVSFQGLEWFIYNRTAAYDNIVSSLSSQVGDADAAPEGRASLEGISSLRKIFSWTSAAPDNTHLGPPVSLVSSIYSRTPTVIKGWLAKIKGQLPSLDPKDLLPISLEITKGAFIIGNESTPTLLVAEYRKSEGSYGIVPSRSKYDLYKQLVNLKFQDVNIRFVDNSRYESNMTTAGQRLHRDIHTANPRPLRPLSYLAFSAFSKLWRRHKLWSSLSSRARSSGFTIHGGHPSSWGRRRAQKVLDEETPLGADFATLEYARQSKIVEAPTLELLYYADSVGQVPGNAGTAPSDDPLDIGNGDLPPEWGVDIAICGGFIRYGPWADRQRALLQQTFFPPTFADSTPFVRLKPGDGRVWPSLNILVELRDGVTLQVPFREASKNWQWDGEVHVPNRPRRREAASIHLRAGDNSTISYMMPMVASARGYEPTINIHLDTITVTSSLNDIRLLRAESCVVRCELPSPLRWNEQRQWLFTISLRTPRIYLLRDHINMITDLGKDWSAGPPPDYNRFIPMVYSVAIEMKNYDIRTYVNDHNIIDKPLIPEENAFLTLHGTHLQTDVTIPLNKYCPEATRVSFLVEGGDIGVAMTLPKWNTRSLYIKPHRSNDLGRVGRMQLKASYCYFGEVHAENIDQLELNFVTKDVIFKACGWSIRHFMILRNNYFGSFTHFSTLYEYLEKQRLGQPLGDPVDLQYREGSSNALQVQLGLTVESGLMVIPAGLRGYEVDRHGDSQENDIGTCTMMALPELQLQLRTHDYYMEMSLDIDRIATTTHAQCPEDLRHAQHVQRSAKEMLIIDGVDIVAHRLFGPLPRTTTYLCIWEFHIGRIMGRMSALEARAFGASARQFGFTFSDPLNAPAAEYDVPTDPDVTFLKATIDELNLVWQADNAAIEFSLPQGLRVDSNDVAGKAYSKVTSVRVPQASLKVLLSRAAELNEWHEASSVELDLNLDLYSAPENWPEKAETQLQFLATQDSHTGRAMFLYMPDQSIPHDTLATGRGLAETPFYLPQIRIPKPSASHHLSPDEVLAETRRVPSGYAPSPLALPRHLLDHSESDGDEYISEADRDARIAKLRPQPRSFAHNDGDDSMSGGDESDTDDLTDSEQSDSDPEKKKGPSLNTIPALQQYGRFTRTYGSRWFHHPSWWHKSPFCMKRDNVFNRHRSLIQKLVEELPDGLDGKTSAEFASCASDGSVATSVIRLSSKSGVVITVMPLIVPAVDILLSDVKDHHLSPELRFDSIIVDHVQSLYQVDEGDRPQNTIFDVRLSKLHIRTLHVISGNLDSPLGHAGEHEHMPSSIELYSENTRIYFAQLISQRGTGRSAHTTLSYDRLGLGTLSPDHLDLTFDVTSGSSQLTLRDQEVSPTLGDITVNISHVAPLQLVRTGLAMHDFAQTLGKSLSALAGGRPVLDQNVIYQAVQIAQDKTILDPLSTIQPSYLIQSGRPHKLRTDAGFKYLVYLRDYLQRLGDSERALLFEPPEDLQSSPTFDQVTQILQDQLKQFSADSDMKPIPPKSPLATLFGTVPINMDTAPKESRPINVVVFKLSRLRTICRSQTEICSEFILRAVAITAHMRTTDCLQPHLVNPAKSTTTLSILDKGRFEIQHIGVIVSVGDVALSIYPSLMRLAQTTIHTLKAHHLQPFGSPRSFSRSPVRSVSPEKPPTRAIYVDLALTARSVKFMAGAEKLTIEYKATAVDFASSMLFSPSRARRQAWDLSINNSLTMDEVRLQACAVADLAQPNEYGVLAAFIIGGGRINMLLKREANASPVTRLVLALSYVHLNVPRSAIRLVRFVEEWTADYLPGLTATIQDLLTELHNPLSTPKPEPSRNKERRLLPSHQIEAEITSLRVSLQVMRGTWVSWDIAHILAYSAYTETLTTRSMHNFGLKIGSQALAISSKEHPTDAAPNVRLRIPLPNFMANARGDRSRVEGLALIEAFAANIKPSHWDTLLTVQQKFGQDFNDLVSIIEKTRAKGSPVQEKTPTSPKKPAPPLKYRVLARMKGFRLGLESGSSTVFLECHSIGGAISNEPALRWHIELSDLALSLALREMASRVTRFSKRENRSAFVSIDARMEMDTRSRDGEQIFKVAVKKVHAVMQPSSIGDLGDFIDHLQAEIAVRKQQRAQDMSEFKEKTKNLLRSLDITTGGSRPQSMSWFDQYTMNVTLANIGVAFPLTLNQEIRLPRSSKQDRGAVRAFLFSIKEITFGSQRGESGQASMKGFSFQFVSQFNQLNDRDYAGESHPSRNRLIYPEMTAQLRVERNSGSRELRIAADVDGFIFDVDSTIPNYVSSLIAVYRHGKDRVERLANVPRAAAYAQEPSQHTGEREFEGLLTSNMFLSLTFRSGRVRMFSQAFIDASKTRTISSSSREPSDDQYRELGAEVFALPVVSVWGEYRATPAANKLNGSRGEPSTLLFKSTVHSSQNTLRPTLLPFLTEVMKNIEDRMRQISKEARPVVMASPRTPATPLPPDGNSNHSHDSSSSMQISLSLRIDKSKLELTCQPDVNVIAGLNWDSGGFVVNISPGAHRVTFSGSVGGLTVGLKHGFLSEDCMKLHARDLAFNVDFAKSRDSTVSTVSVVCDTEFSGGVRFSRLQDILCFKAVWLDRIPIINAPPATPPGLGSRSTSYLTTTTVHSPKQELTTALLLRLRRVRLDIDLGQSITSIQLNLQDAVVRTRLKEAISELSLSVYEVSAIATGNLSGRIAVPNFMFQTIQKERTSSDSNNRLLDLHMTSGPLDIDLESEYQKLILYRAEPLDVRVFDDWSKFTSEGPQDERSVRLTVTMKGTDVTAIMTVGTVPKLVSYGNKFKANLDAQKEGASRESQAFRLSNAPKPENPLSEVANAMFLSARSKFKEDPGFSCVVGQRLDLKLKTLRLVIFPRSMRDPELAQFIGADIHARLDRVVESDALPPARDLHLSFASISISKMIHLNYSLAAKEPEADCLHWLTALTKNAAQATIFSLPSMDMRMFSDEVLEDGARVLPYNFSSKFSDSEGIRDEDIYITLNMALYSWLTILRKTFAREMEQVQASADVRPPAVGGTQPPALRRSKVPEPLQTRQDRDFDSSRREVESPEPLSPPSGVRTSLPHTRSMPARYATMSPTPSDPPSPQTHSQGTSGIRIRTTSPVEEVPSRAPSPGLPATKKTAGLTYRPRERTIERLTLRQLGEATPDVMHPFFMKTAGFSLEDSLPQYVHEYATMPTEEIMKALLKLYSKQLKVDNMPELK